MVPTEPIKALGMVLATKGAPCSHAIKNEIGPATQGNPPIQPPIPVPQRLTARVTLAMSSGIIKTFIKKMVLIKAKF
jgi:hypothetical protein